MNQTTINEIRAELEIQIRSNFYQKPEFLMANGNEQLIPKINELLKLSENVKYSYLF